MLKEETVQLEREDSFTFQGTSDVLSASLGTPEHPGRLRGHPQGYVGKKTLFSNSKRKGHTHSACHASIAEVSNFTKLNKF